MLDNGTKKRVDSARDILVGGIPKSQVEQITIAMIYKFMDDMNNQTEELIGKATFLQANSNSMPGAACWTANLGDTNVFSSMPRGLRR